MDDSAILITGANGQLGRALQAIYPKAKKADIGELDITDGASVSGYDWSGIEVLINAAAYTDVDGAETPEGRTAAWKVNDEAVGNLVEAAKKHDLTLVHIATDYDFDGTKKEPYREDDSPNPLSVYGKSKSAGTKKVALSPKHYIIRTAWVVGDGKNFVRTMLDLGAKGVEPKVVSDQTGRLTFTPQLALAIDYLLKNRAPYGTYNVTNEGRPASWADITREIFKDAGYNLKVSNTTTDKYFSSKPHVAPRPHNSVLDLSKIEATGFKPRDWREDLKDYVKKEAGR